MEALRYITRLSQEEVNLISTTEKKFHRSELRVWGTYSTINIDGHLSKFEDNEEVIVVDVTNYPWMKKLGVMHGRTQINGMTSIIIRHEIKASYIGIAVVKVNRNIILVDYDYAKKEKLKQIAEIKCKEDVLRKREYEIVKKNLKEEDCKRRANYEYNKFKNTLKQESIEYIELRKSKIEEQFVVGHSPELGLTEIGLTEIGHIQIIKNVMEAYFKEEADKISTERNHISIERLALRMEKEDNEKLIRELKTELKAKADQLSTERNQISIERLALRMEKEENEKLIRGERLVLKAEADKMSAQRLALKLEKEENEKLIRERISEEKKVDDAYQHLFKFMNMMYNKVNLPNQFKLSMIRHGYIGSRSEMELVKKKLDNTGFVSVIEDFIITKRID